MYVNSFEVFGLMPLRDGRVVFSQWDKDFIAFWKTLSAGKRYHDSPIGKSKQRYRLTLERLAWYIGTESPFRTWPLRPL
jgi:hypothetical protein